MKKYALFFDRLELQNKPYLMSEEMEQSTRYAKISDWYNHTDDVAAAFKAKDRENADLRARLAAVRERCEANNWMGTARVCGEKGE